MRPPLPPERPCFPMTLTGQSLTILGRFIQEALPLHLSVYRLACKCTLWNLGPAQDAAEEEAKDIRVELEAAFDGLSVRSPPPSISMFSPEDRSLAGGLDGGGEDRAAPPVSVAL